MGIQNSALPVIDGDFGRVFVHSCRGDGIHSWPVDEAHLLGRLHPDLFPSMMACASLRSTYRTGRPNKTSHSFVGPETVLRKSKSLLIRV